MAFDDLGTRGGRASAAMALTSFSTNKVNTFQNSHKYVDILMTVLQLFSIDLDKDDRNSVS